MKMFSPKAYLLEFLSKNLSDWIEDVKEDSVDIGLLDGDLHMNDLFLKKKSFKISGGLKLALEFGVIDSLSIQVPWTQIHTGLVNVFIDNLQVVLRLIVIDAESADGDKEDSSFTDGIKMDKLSKAELELLGHETTQSWLTKYAGSLLSSMISRVASKFSLICNNVQLALVIPTEALEESLCINLQIGSLILDKLKASDLHAGSSKTVFQDFVFTKEIDIKGITMSMGFIPTPIQRTDFEYIFENSHGMFQTFVNPCGAVSVWKGMKEKDSDIHIKSIKTLQISLMVKNVEITPSVHQLVSVKEVADYLKNECIKRKFTSLRKALGIQKTIHRFKKRRFNAREMWMFATNAVLIILRERGGYTFSPSLRTGLLRLGLRRIYRQLYTKVIEIRLGLVKCEDAEIIIPPDNSNSRNLAEAYSDYGLSWSEQKKFDDLHRLFSVKELVFFRGLVHHQLQRKGFTRAELLTAIVGKPKKSQWSFYGLSFFSDNVHVEKDVKASSSSIFPHLTDSSSGQLSDSLMLEFACTIGRTAFTILEAADNSQFDFNWDSSMKNFSDKKLGCNNLKQHFSIVVYGANTKLLSSGDTDKMLQVHLGSVRMYGYKGEEIFACGGDPDKWLESSMGSIEDICSKHIKERALIFSIQLRRTFADVFVDGTESKQFSANDDLDLTINGGFNSRDIFTFLDNAKSKVFAVEEPESLMVRLMRLSDRHIVVEVRCGVINVLWNTKTLHYLYQLSSSLLPPPSHLKSHSHKVLKQRLAYLSLYRGSHGVLDGSAKVSVEGMLDGVNLRIPLPKSRSRHVDESEKNIFNKVGRDTTLEEESSQWCLKLEISKVSLQAGDFLENYLLSKSSTHDIKYSNDILKTESKFSNFGSPLNKDSTPGTPDSENILSEARIAPFDAATDTFDEYQHYRVKKVLMKVKSSVIRPVVFNLSGISLYFEYDRPKHGGYDSRTSNFAGGTSFSSKGNLLAGDFVCQKQRLICEPWSLQSVLSLSDAPANPSFTDIRLDLLSSALSIAASTQDLERIIDVCSEIEIVFSPVITALKHEVFVPRIKRLASLSVFFLNVSIDSVEVSYLKPRNAQKIEDNSFRTSTLLKNLAVKVAERGRFCGTCRVLADRIIKKLLTMFPTYSALDIKAMVNNFALSIDTNMRSSDEEIQIFLNTLFPNGVYGTVHKDLDLWNTAICSLRISSLNLLLHQLTYDSKVLLTLSEAGVYDLDQNSMISFQAVAPIRLDEAKEQEINDSSVQDSGDDRSVDDYVGKKSEQRLNSDFISADNEIPDIVRRYDEEYFSLNKYEENSLTILYSEKDFDYKVGYGGTDISVLYEGEISQPSCQKRDGNSILACKVLDISLSANNWLDTIKCTLEAAVSISHYYDTTRKTLLKKRNQFLRRFNKRKRSGKSSHEEMMFLPSKSRATANSKKRIEVPTIRCIVLVAKLKSVLLTLSNHDNLLGLLMFDGLYVKFTDILNDFGQCKMKASLDSATAMDLSEAGSVHSEVFWKARNFDQLTSPLVRATLKQNTTENICHFTLSLVVRGLRVCFLYRFIQEMIEFAMLSIAQPLKVLIEKSLYIQSETLYDGAEYVSCTESSCDETCSDEESISKVRYSKGLSETYSKLRNKQGEPYQSDSAESSTTDYFSSDKSTGHDVTSVHLDKEDRKSRMVVDVVISLQDLSVILPRNSTSHELLAANLDSGLVHIYCTDESWSLLNPSELVDNLNPLEDDSNLPLHFDIPSNTWGYHFASVNETEDSKSKGCNSWEDQLLGESFDFQNFWQGKTDFSITENWDSEDDELQFFDALESCTPYSGSEKTARDTPITVPFDIKRLYAEKVFPRIAVTGTGLDIFSVTNSSRNNLDASAQSDAIKNTEIHLHWLFEEVRDKGLVKRYADQLASVPSNESRDVWRQMNNSHLNCTFVLDITDTQIRILVGDTADISTIAVALAQSEFYLILGMVFENIFEVPQFGTKVVGSAQKSENNTGAISSSDDSSGIDATFEPRRDGKQNFGGSKENMAFQSYGTKEYLEYLLTNRNHWLELVVVRAEVELKCLIDSNYFPMKIPSNDCLRNLRGRHRFDSKTTPSMKKSEKQSSPSNIHIPVALIKASGVFFHMVMDHDVIMMNFSCGNISVEDIRIPTVSIHPVALQVPSGDSIRKDSVESEIRNYRRLYGHSDFLFGFSEDYTSLECPLDKPVKFSFLSSNTSNWMTSNFGLCEPDLNLSNMDLIFLVSEYFSCYFRFAEFGHPSLSAYNLLDPSVIPYGATDTRVFLFKPHITIMSSPLQINSQTLVFDTDYGAYFRYILDTDSAVKMELKVIELALVLMKKFRFGKESRGLRGAAGSGRGVRTLVEFLNLDYFYQFSPIENQIDVKIDISNTSTEEEFVVNDDESSEPMYGTTTNGRRKIVKSNLKMKDPKDSTEKISSINRYSVELEPVRIPFPHCVFPLVPPDTEFTANSCDVVTGVEDLVLTLQLLDKFWPGGIGLSNRITSQNKTSLSSGKSRGTQKLDNMKAAESLKSPSMYMIVSFVGVRVILVDNILGLHLPLMQGFLQDFQCTFDSTDLLEKQSLSIKSNNDPISPRRRGSSDIGRLFSSLSPRRVEGVLEEPSSSSDNMDARCFVKLNFWIDYFNNMKKCWEPLLEKLVLTGSYEKSDLRGTGMVLRMASGLHLNMSGAFFHTLNDLVRSAQVEGAANRGDFSDHFDNEQGFPPTPLAIRDTTLNSEMVNTFQNRKKEDLPSSFRQVSSRLRKPRRGTFFNFEEDIPSRTLMEVRTKELSKRISHTPSQPLGGNMRVGFSIHNLTGQPVRYLQQWEGGVKTVQYLNNGERGLLNFVASTTLIRNNLIVEETFNVQMEKNADSRSRNKKKIVGNRVALQVSGYRWLRGVQADELGFRFEHLEAVLGRKTAGNIYSDQMIVNSLKLVTEVIPHCGGRMLKLRSVFLLKNNTRHSINILAKQAEDMESDDWQPSAHQGRELPFQLNAGCNHYVPMALLQNSALRSKGRSLGLLYLQPTEIGPIEDELEGIGNLSPSSVDYTTDPINLYQTVAAAANAAEDTENVAKTFGEYRNLRVHKNDSAISDSGDLHSGQHGIQLCCNVNPMSRRGTRKSSFSGNRSFDGDRPMENRRNDFLRDEDFVEHNATNKLPLFCYCVEVLRHRAAHLYKGKQNRVRSFAEEHHLRNEQTMAERFFNVQGNKECYSPEQPYHYTIVIHPPIVLENLLPTGGIFELVHAVHRRVLWTSWISAGTAVPVHTVTLDEPLLLLINLKYCRTSEGTLIHQPGKFREGGVGLAGRIQRTLEGLLEETENTDTYIILTDTTGQKLRLNIENTEGGGGQRHVAVYSTYWILNTSQFTFRIREEGTFDLPAGTVTMQRDGSKPVPHSNAFRTDSCTPSQDYALAKRKFMHTESKERTKNDSTFLTPSKKKHQHSESIEIDKKIEALVYPGLCGSLHRMQQKEFPYNSTLRNLLEELSFDQQMDLAYMFSYIDETNLLRRRVSLQLDDSNWTRPFSLDSVGVNQVLFVNHPIRGRMEIGFKTSVAPGRLAKYTRIVRLLPRFIIVNNLSSNLRVLQPNGFAGEVSETTVLANHIQPYHLPAVFGERQLSLEVDGSWARSVPFSIDQTGVFTVKVQKNIDLASVQHINTRGATEYTVQLPFLKSLGVWFETDWGETNIVVKSLQPGSFAAIKTDIQVGDVLLAVNDELVDGKDFDGAISKIKAIISTDGGFLTFRTVEEKMRLLRETAMYQHAVKDINTRRRPSVLVPAFSQDSHDLPDQYELEQSNEIMQAILSKTSVDCMILKVELRPVESSIAIIVQEQNLEVQPEYRIENKSVCYVIHIKQKGVKGNTWITLNPGQSIAYVLDDPFKQHKLQILVGKNLLCPVMYNRNNSNHFISNRTKDLSSIGNGDDGLGSYLSYLAGVSLDSCTVIDIDRIGAKAFVNIPSADVKLVAIVKSEGPTKILSILPGLDNQILIRELRYTTEFINEQMHQIDNIREKIEAILSSLGEEDSDRASSFRATGGSFSEAVDYTVASLVASEMENAVTYLKERQKKLVEVNDQFQSDSRVPLRRNQGDIRDDTNTCKGTTLTSYAPFEELLGSEITSKHQLLVDVLEAKDLTVSSTGNVADTYCKVYIRADDPAFFNSGTSKQTSYTYICEQSLNPIWVDQRFIFEIPPRVANEARGFTLRVVVKSRSITGFDQFLGRTDIQFNCLKEEKVLSGWFALRPASTSLASTMKYKYQAFDVTGSIKLNLQWIHTDIGLTAYMLKAIECRDQELKLQLTVQKFFLKHLQKLESNKAFVLKMQNYKQVERDYYDLFSNLSRREIYRRTRRVSMLKERAISSLNSETRALDSTSRMSFLTRGTLTQQPFDRSAFETSTRDFASTSERSDLDRAKGSTPSKARASSLRIPRESSLARSLSIFSEVGEYKDGSDAMVNAIHSPSVDSILKTRSEHNISPNKRAKQRDYVLTTQRFRPIPCIPTAHFSILRGWVKSSAHNTKIHSRFASTMERNPKTVEENRAFKDRFEKESQRSFIHVHTQAGVLEVIPMQALHIPISKHPMLVRLSYGNESQSTFSVPSAAYLTWYQESNNSGAENSSLSSGAIPFAAETNADISYGPTNAQDGIYPRTSTNSNSMNESLKMQFAVDTLNVRGNLRVRVMKECLPREKEVARLDIPIFNLLDCICDVDGDGYYDRWFSLVLGTESVPAEGELEKQKQSVLPERPSHHKFEYHPCIRLRMRWIAREGIERINDSKLYCRIQLPFFSVAVIDSEHAREVMQISIDNVEARHSVTTDFTDTSVNIMWMQVDNQLPNPVSPVIVAPTRVKYPQPVLRLHLRKKNLLSKESLTSYETFQLIIQELDLKLEQQTVIASWELIKSWLQERRQSNDSTHSDEQIAGSSMDNLGFATCYDIVQYELLPTLQNNFTLLQRLNANTVGNERNQLNINSVGDGIKRSREKRRPALLDTESVEADDERKLYVEDFKIYPIKINVSFLTTPQVISQSEKYEHRSSIRNEGTAGLYSTASLFMWQVGEVVLDLTSSISDAPLSFNGFVAPHLFKSEVEVAKRLQEHYLHWAYFQLYKIVGSLDVVGNPIGLLSSLGVGVKDFFYEPAHALITSPTEIRKIGRTFFKGALSLVSNTTAGFVGTGVTITRSIGRGVAKLSMDDSYMKVREKLQKPPRSIRAAALRPAKDLGYGFLHGIVGLVRVPYSHVRRKGFGALLPGVVKGIVGIAADPVVGTLDALTHSGDAVRDMLKYSSKIPNEPIQRMRLSELFGVDGRILPYNFTIALGTYVMQALDRSTDESLIIGQSDDGTSAIFRNAKSIIRRTAKQDAVSLNPTSTNRLSLVHQYNSARKGTLDSGSTSDGRNGQPHASMNLMRRLSLRGYEDYNSPASYLSEYFGDDDQSKYAETAVSEGDPPESVGKEFVIYTGIIRKLPGMDLVVVVSTARVIITEYHRKQKGAYLKIQWVALLKSMEPPEFQKSGGGCSLTLTAGKAHTRGKGRSSLSSSKVPRRSLRSEPSQIGSLYTLEGGYHEEDMLINISNCINTLLGNFLRLLPMQGNRRGDCEEDEFGIVHIGAWQFAKESSLNEQIDRSVTSDPGYSTEEIYNVINELEKEQWMFGVASRASGSSDVNEAIISIPKWLREEQLAAIKSHANVADVFTYLEENYQQLAKRVYTKAAVEQLMRGIVSFEEFKEVISGKNQHEDNDSITDSKCEVKKKKKKMSLLSLVGVGNTVKRGSSGILKPAVDDIADDESVASSTAGSYSRISNVFSFSAKSLGAAASLVLPGNNRGIHRNGSTSNSPDPTKISSDNLYDMNSLDKLSANNKFPFANYSRERSLVDKNFEGKNISFENGWSTSPNNSGSAKPYTIYETENEQSGSSSLKHPAVFKAIDSGNKGLRMDIQEILEEKEDDDEDSDGERTVIQTRKHLTKGGDNHSGAFQTSAEKLMASDTSFSYSDLNSAISRGIQTPDSLNAFEEGFMSAKDGNINQTPLLHFSDGFAVILSKSETHQKADLPIPLRENPLFQKKRDRLHSPQSSSAELAIQQTPQSSSFDSSGKRELASPKDEGDGEGNVLDRLQRVEEMLLVAFGDSRDSTLASNTLDAFESPARPVDSQKLATSGPISPLLAAAVTELANIRKEMQRPAEQSKGRSEDYEQNEYRRSRNEEVKRDSTQSDGEKIQDSAKNDMEDSTD